MGDGSKGHKLYIPAEGGTATDNTPETLTFATATVVGGDDGASYTCNGTLTVTASDTFTNEGAWDEGDAFIEFDNETGITTQTISIGTPIDLKTGTKSGNIEFKLTEGSQSPVVLKGKIYVVNDENKIQNTTGHNIAGTTLKVSVDITGIKCQKDNA